MVPARIGILLSTAALFALAGCKASLSDLIGGKSSDLPTTAASVAPSQVAVAPVGGTMQNVDFGDDASQFSKDGECDDKRFTGAGMTSTPLLESDVRHDATDCRGAFNQGRLTLKDAGSSTVTAQQTYAPSGTDHVIWGDDASKFSKDGECDDMRFTGAGMTDTPLLESDVKHDATDCRTAYDQGRLTLK